MTEILAITSIGTITVYGRAGWLGPAILPDSPAHGNWLGCCNVESGGTVAAGCPILRGRREDVVSSLAIFIIGFVIVIAGLAYGASLAGLPPQWIGVMAVVLGGIGIVMGVSKTRMKDPSHD
jgi:hypothetical protein